MKLIIAGSRTLCPSIQFISNALTMHNVTEKHNSITEIVSGGAKGVDKEGQNFAHYSIYKPLKLFHADWEKHGKAAGPIRNRQMAEYADVLLLIWDGESKGSSNMKKEMLKLKKPVYEVILKNG